MTDDPLGSILNAPPPALTEAESRALLRAHWGLDGQLDRLTSERDLNWHLQSAEGDFVLKFANPVEPPEVTRFQNRALLHIAARDPRLPVPRVIPARDGRTEVALPQGLMRLLSWVGGAPLHLAPRGPALRRAIGAMAAGLTRALDGFADPAAHHVLQWDIKQAHRLRPLLPAIADADLRALCARRLDWFDGIRPALAALPAQVVHADLNPSNLLTDPGDPARLSGVLDFGDMVHTPRICDLAIAASYQIEPAAAEATLAEVAAGWDSILPLLPGERVLLPGLTAIRMVTTLAIASHRAILQPGNAAYILRNVPAARAGLLALPAP